MFQKKALFPIISLILVLSSFLAACTSAPTAGLTLAAQVKTSDPVKMAVVDKLGVGILKMEGTSQAVTTNQASALLPLWKAVFKMGNDTSASQVEVTALYEQIEETLTSEQVNSIQQLTWTQQELSELKQKYGSTPAGQSASASTSTSSSAGSNAGAGGPPMGGGPMDDITSVGLNSGQNAASSTTSGSNAKVSKTSTSASLNPVFASAVIKVLN